MAAVADPGQRIGAYHPLIQHNPFCHVFLDADEMGGNGSRAIHRRNAGLIPERRSILAEVAQCDGTPLVSGNRSLNFRRFRQAGFVPLQEKKALPDRFAGGIAGHILKAPVDVDQGETLLLRVGNDDAVARFVDGTGKQIQGNIYWAIHDRSYLTVSFRFFSSSSAGRYPGDCAPLPKTRFGVPLTPSFLPSANTLPVDVSQFALAGAMPFSIKSSHALTGSFAQCTLRTITSEFGKIGYMKIYRVTSVTLTSSFSRRLQYV